MSQHNDDDLQAIWKQHTEEVGGSIPMALLLREKRRSLLDLVSGQSLAEYTVSVALAPLMAFAAWRAKTGTAELGFAWMALVLTVGSIVVWANQRAANARCRVDSSVAEYQRQLLALYDDRIRFLKFVKFWYAIPLLAGAGLVLIPIIPPTVSTAAGVAAVSVLLLLAWLGIWRENDFNRVRELRERRGKVEKLIEQMQP